MSKEAAAAKPSRVFGLSEQDVHLWALSLDDSRVGWLRRLEHLSPDERARAERFRFDRDRSRFIVARAGLREILGEYLGVPARDVAFQYGPWGKPALASEMASDIEFNLSHCLGFALVAVAAGRRVGVDLEFVAAEAVDERMAERFFSAREVASLRALPRELQGAAFFACWTRKEAYVKARGEGLSIPLAGFSVSLTPDEPAALLECAADPEEVSTWLLRDLVLAPGYRGALAVDHGPFSLHCRDWPVSGNGPASPEVRYRSG